MNRLQTQQGFSLVEALLIIVIVAVIAFVGLRVYQANVDTNQTLQNSQDASNVLATTKSLNDQLEQAYLISDEGRNTQACSDQSNTVKSVMLLHAIAVNSDFATADVACSKEPTKTLWHVVFNKQDNTWKLILQEDTTVTSPPCSIVDKYKIPKKIAAQCLVTGSQARTNAY